MNTRQRIKARKALGQLIPVLLNVIEKENESHGIWDYAVSNLAYGNVDKSELVKSTYEATAIHSCAMDDIRATTESIQDVCELIRSQGKD